MPQVQTSTYVLFISSLARPSFNHVYVAAAKQWNGCTTNDQRIVLWTAGKRRKGTYSYVWKVRRNPPGPERSHLITFHDRHYDMVYTNWDPNWPRFHGKCVAVLSGNDYRWAEIDCGKRFCFVCENA